jgi:hypothetical protein
MLQRPQFGADKCSIDCLNLSIERQFPAGNVLEMHNATKLETMLGSVGLVRTAQSPGEDQESIKRSGSSVQKCSLQTRPAPIGPEAQPATDRCSRKADEAEIGWVPFFNQPHLVFRYCGYRECPRGA